LKLQNCLIVTHGRIKQASLLILPCRKEVLLNQGAVVLLRTARRQQHAAKDNDTGKQQKAA
jgi:hypothetical protein